MIAEFEDGGGGSGSDGGGDNDRVRVYAALVAAVGLVDLSLE